MEIRWGGADTIAPFASDTRPYLEGIPGAAGLSAGHEVRHGDFFPFMAQGAGVRSRVAVEAAGFFLRHPAGPPTA